MMYVLQFIWELPQNITGAVFFLLAKAGGRIVSTRFRNRRLLVAVKKSGVSLGSFVFYPSTPLKPSLEEQNRRHEIGHAVQSMWLGPLYLPVVGIPSFMRFLFSYYQSRVNGKVWTGYYSGFPEKWADRLGGVRYRHW